jgi:hypothetical protein
MTLTIISFIEGVALAFAIIGCGLLGYMAIKEKNNDDQD